MLIDIVRNAFSAKEQVEAFARHNKDLSECWEGMLRGKPPIVFESTDVAKYLDLFIGDREEISHQDGVYIQSPSYENMWVEWVPQRAPTCGAYFDVSRVKRVGALGLSMEREKLVAVEPSKKGVLRIEEECGAEIKWVTRWSFILLTYGSQDIHFNLFYTYIPIDHEGNALSQGYFSPLSEQALGEEELNVATIDLSWMVRIPMMTQSLLHARNVSIVPHLPPQGQQRKREKHGKLPLMRYHTLNILTPTQQASFKPGARSANATSNVPWHTVRGHFADYRKHGLFGKHKGVFWVPSHHRGTREAGIVEKDYRVIVGKEPEQSQLPLY